MKITNRIPSIHAPGIPDQIQDAIDRVPNSASLSNGLAGLATDVFETSETSRISSLVEKYKGPDVWKRPEIESQVESYKGPKSLFDERGSRVEKYKGSDSTEGQIFIVPEPVRMMINISGLDKYFSIVVSEADAIQLLNTSV